MKKKIFTIVLISMALVLPISCLGQNVPSVLVGTWVWEFKDDLEGIHETSSLTITADGNFELEDGWQAARWWGNVLKGTVTVTDTNITLNPATILVFHEDEGDRNLSPEEQESYRKTYSYAVSGKILTMGDKKYIKD